MSRYRLTPEALRDLDEIVDYISRENPAAALRVINSIEQKCRTLAEMPELGRLREELAPGLRSLTAGNYLIFYRPTDGGINVIRVAHGSRDLPQLFN